VADAVNTQLRERSVPTAGLGLRTGMFDAATACTAAGMWFEVHPENYMVDGGPRLSQLETVRARHPISLHGVGLSLAADVPPDVHHLQRLRALVRRFDPFLVSEHLAWSTWDGVYRPDLLPIPRTDEALARVATNIAHAQDVLQRQLLVENPSHYLCFSNHDYDELEFLTELCRRTGCGLLLDVNNTYVSARNLTFDAQAFLDAVPAQYIGELHLAGHSHDPSLGAALLIDSHDTPVCNDVWRLYARLIRRVGHRPTLLERDDAIPAFDTLLEERNRAAALLHAGGRCDAL